MSTEVEQFKSANRKQLRQIFFNRLSSLKINIRLRAEGTEQKQVLLKGVLITTCGKKRSLDAPITAISLGGKATVNLQTTKLFIVTSATKGVVTTPLRFRVRFKILYRVIRPLIQHCLLHKMVYLNVKYVIATRSYDFFCIYTQNLIGNITLSRVIISVASVN